MSNKKIVITGLSGMVGSYLKGYLEKRGYGVYGPSIKDLQDEEMLRSLLEDSVAVINLAGRNIFSKRWTKKEKKKLYNSRIETTKTLVRCMNKLENGPEVFISASAVGYYGINAQNVDENSPCGKDFLAKLCEDWEQASHEYTKGRVVNPRFAVILSKDGGFLQRIIKLTKFGFLSVFGKGNQLMNFISIDDVAKVIHRSIEDSELQGPINMCFSSSIPQKTAFEVIAKRFNRRLRFSIPKFFVNLLFGEMGTAVFLADQEIQPKRLQDLGYEYVHEDMQQYLNSL